VKQRMKVIRFLGAIFVLLLLCGLPLLAAGQPPRFGDRALKIDGVFVDPAIFDDEQNRFFLRWSTNAMMLKKSDEERMDMLLEEIINRVAVVNYLNRYAKVTVTSQEVTAYINRYVKTKYETESQLADYMARFKYKNEAEMRQGVKIYLLRLKYFPKIAREMGVTIPAKELNEQYNQHVSDSRRVEVKHILITDPDPAKAKKRADDVYLQLKNGADFGKMVNKYSADEGTKANGGLMGSFAKGAVGMEFDEKVFTAKPGSLIPPMRMGNGYEIYRVTKFIGFYHSKAEFTDMMILEKFGESEQFKKWIAKAKTKMSIEILDPAFKAFRLSVNKQYDQAGTYYEKAFGVYKNEMYLTRAGESYRASKNWNRLIRLGQLGMAKFPGNVPFYLDKGEGLYRSGKTKDALALLKKAETLSKNSIYYTGMIMNLYTRLGLKKDAARMQQKLKTIK
jgi:parvulin-like peptidyl-prolyl isomerase